MGSQVLSVITQCFCMDQRNGEIYKHFLLSHLAERPANAADAEETLECLVATLRVINLKNRKE